jgi:hypothetical protein
MNESGDILAFAEVCAVQARKNHHAGTEPPYIIDDGDLRGFFGLQLYGSKREHGWVVGEP